MPERGGYGRRDFAVSLLLVVGLTCSGVGVTMTVVVAIAAFLRRGWRVTAAILSIPVVVYGTWYVLEGTEGQRNTVALLDRDPRAPGIRVVGTHRRAQWSDPGSRYRGDRARAGGRMARVEIPAPARTVAPRARDSGGGGRLRRADRAATRRPRCGGLPLRRHHRGAPAPDDRARHAGRRPHGGPPVRSPADRGVHRRGRRVPRRAGRRHRPRGPIRALRRRDAAAGAGHREDPARRRTHRQHEHPRHSVSGRAVDVDDRPTRSPRRAPGSRRVPRRRPDRAYVRGGGDRLRSPVSRGARHRGGRNRARGRSRTRRPAASTWSRPRMHRPR